MRRHPKEGSDRGTRGHVCRRASRRCSPGAGAAIEGLLAEHGGPGTTASEAIQSRAQRALEAAIASDASTVGATPRRAGRELGYAPSWSESERTLEVLVVVRAERELVTEQPNEDPRAGSIWCDAPPGADCAPQCVSPRWLVTRAFVGEAAVTVLFAHDGARLRVVDEREGAPRPRMRRQGVGDCN